MVIFLQDVFENDDSKFSKSTILINSILVWFDYGNKRKDDVLPSVMEMLVSLPLSYLDVMRAYVELKQMGIITFDRNRGWVILKGDYLSCMDVLVVLNNMTPYKQTLLDAMATRFGERAVLETFIFNNDIDEFKRFLSEKHADYHKIAVIPYFIDNLPFPSELKDIIPQRKLLFVEEKITDNIRNIATLYTMMERDIYRALRDMFSMLTSYPLVLLVMEQNTLYARQFLTAFKKFCKFVCLEYKVVDSLAESGLTRGEIFIFTLDKYTAQNLVHICTNGWKFNKSTRRTPSRLRKSDFVVYNGIATFTDEYEVMGFLLADRILG